MGDMIDCVQKKCQLEPETDDDDEDKNENVVEEKKNEEEEEHKDLDNKNIENNPQSVNEHYYMNSVKDLPIFGDGMSIKTFDE